MLSRIELLAVDKRGESGAHGAPAVRAYGLTTRGWGAAVTEEDVRARCQVPGAGGATPGHPKNYVPSMPGMTLPLGLRPEVHPFGQTQSTSNGHCGVRFLAKLIKARTPRFPW